ncbi:hypothetical protein WG902_11570 [Ramlibacter sp. PS3R-8]|uniref:hypothetical protein n=1 Tax=Ramlibacter sp. PS3R-8 TaxID=3133437 RepID=UPI00309CE832
MPDGLAGVGEPLAEQLAHRGEPRARLGQGLAHLVVEFLLRVAVTEGLVECRTQRGDGVLLVLLAARAHGFRHQLVDGLLGVLQSLVPAILDARDVEAFQLLDAAADAFTHRLDLGSLLGTRGRLAVGHAALLLQHGTLTAGA